MNSVSINAASSIILSYNSQWMVEAQTQYSNKFNIWAGTLNNALTGSIFIEGNHNAHKYKTMLYNEIVWAIRNISGDNFEHIWIQQDRAGPNYGRNEEIFLDKIFPNQWIGKRGDIEWPPRSPDLSLLDYFVRLPER